MELKIRKHTAKGKRGAGLLLPAASKQRRKLNQRRPKDDHCYRPQDDIAAHWHRERVEKQPDQHCTAAKYVDHDCSDEAQAPPTILIAALDPQGNSYAEQNGTQNRHIEMAVSFRQTEEFYRGARRRQQKEPKHQIDDRIDGEERETLLFSHLGRFSRTAAGCNSFCTPSVCPGWVNYSRGQRCQITAGLPPKAAIGDYMLVLERRLDVPDGLH